LFAKTLADVGDLRHSQIGTMITFLSIGRYFAWLDALLGTYPRKSKITNGSR
jgi:hypothetical protein